MTEEEKHDTKTGTCTRKKCCCNCAYDIKHNGGYNICSNPEYWREGFFEKWEKMGGYDWCWKPITEKNEAI